MLSCNERNPSSSLRPGEKTGANERERSQAEGHLFLIEKDTYFEIPQPKSMIKKKRPR